MADVRSRLGQLGGVAVVVLMCAAGWFLLRSTDASESAVPAPITVPARESGVASTPTRSTPPSPYRPHPSHRRPLRGRHPRRLLVRPTLRRRRRSRVRTMTTQGATVTTAATTMTTERAGTRAGGRRVLPAPGSSAGSCCWCCSPWPWSRSSPGGCSIRTTDERMDVALRAEVEEFTQIVESGRRPGHRASRSPRSTTCRDGHHLQPGPPEREVPRLRRRRYRFQSRIEAPVLLSEDAAFTELVGAVTETSPGSYESAARGGPLPGRPGDPGGRPGPRGRRRRLLRRPGAGGRRRRGPADAGASAPAPCCSRPPAPGWWRAASCGRSATSPPPPRASPRPTCPGASRSTAGRRRARPSWRAPSTPCSTASSAGVAAQRRFLDDAGHELRTPITIVRGHLEVLDPADPDDVRETVALVDDELDRMNRMVSDLLLLARAEQPAVRAAAAGGRRRAHRRGVRQGAPARRPRLGAGDRRAASTRARPAADHPGAGGAGRQRRPLHRARRPDRASAASWRAASCGSGSSDAGPGIAEADRARVFERFARGAAGAPPVRRRRPGAGDRAGDRRGPRRPRRCSTACPGRAPRSPSSCRPTSTARRRTHEPDPDRRGRAAHRLVHREGAAGQRLRDRRWPPTDGPLGA